MEGHLNLLLRVHASYAEEIARCLRAKWASLYSDYPLIVRDLFACLLCKSRAIDADMSLPPLLDDAWHFAILQTREYAALCTDMGGLFLHHSTLSEQDSLTLKHARCEALARAYASAFGRAVPSTPHWQLEQAAAPKKRAREEESLFVETVEINGKRSILHYRPDATVSSLVRPGDHIIFKGKRLDDNVALSSYNIPAGATVYLVGSLRGC